MEQSSEDRDTIVGSAEGRIVFDGENGGLGTRRECHNRGREERMRGREVTTCPTSRDVGTSSRGHSSRVSVVLGDSSRSRGVGVERPG